MTIIQQGTVNTNSLTVPDLFVQIQAPNNAVINGVPSNVLALVGTATWGPVNSPTNVGSLAQYQQTFGAYQTNKYDMGTHVAVAVLQGANVMKCVRVTDGTDVAATAAVLDTTTSANVTGINLTALYTGTTGNTLVATVAAGSSTTVATPTYKLTLALPGYTPEIFDNIGGSGAAVWTNMMNAVNLGQSGIRGPSQLAVASLGNGVGSGTVTAAGSYATLPSLPITGGGGGSGATATLKMKAVSATVSSGGSGYSIGDTITLAGGTNTAPVVLTVATVSTGAVATVTVTTPGNYTALPASPVAQATTSGSGTGATFTVLWGLLSVVITASGSGYTSAPTGTVTGGGGSGGGTVTLTVGSTQAPASTAYTLSGGTSGISGVTASTLIGVDTVPRTGMYALRGTGSNIVDLCDCDDSTKYTNQVAYGLSEGSYMIMVGPSGQSVSSAISAKQTAGIDSYTAKLLIGDWCYFNDTVNNQLRLISPQGFVAGCAAALSPEQSTLNKQIYGITATQKTAAKQTYSAADLQSIAGAGLDLITNPVPGGQYFGVRFGRNTSSNASINEDNYTRLTYFIAETLNAAMGQYVGQLQTTTLQTQARSTLNNFLSNMVLEGMIGTVDGSPAFSVVLGAANNPPSRVALGYMQADIQVTYLSVIQFFLVNITGGQSVQVQIGTTIPAQQ